MKIVYTNALPIIYLQQEIESKLHFKHKGWDKLTEVWKTWFKVVW